VQQWGNVIAASGDHRLDTRSNGHQCGSRKKVI
jgi:hypothetical protein